MSVNLSSSLPLSVAFVLAASSITAQPSSSAPDVLTYHGDNLRTGWFSSETQLTTSNVNFRSFGLLKIVKLDGRVDAEPLVVIGQEIDGQGVHDVVYVATENNSVYAIDGSSGAILWHRNFGAPVPYEYKNFDDNVIPIMGILGTPVIDRTLGTMYLVADIYAAGADTFYLHAISLSNGQDLLKPVAIQFSETLADGSTWTFNPQFHLQRAGLLKASDSIYVAFGSNGDTQPDQSRGSIVRFDAATLKQLRHEVTDSLTAPASSYYLSSIWQSGYAPAADAGGDIYFSTGNSDPNNPSYSRASNRPDSMIRLSGDLSATIDSFTPANYFELDQSDVDLGSGGMMLLPDQGGAHRHLAVAGGKDGRAFLINRDHFGGYTQDGPDKVLQSVFMGSCWCGPAYFVGSDGSHRVVTGGANGVSTWKVVVSPSTQLVYESSTGPGAVNGLPDNGGVIPVISSNGTAPGSAIVWFVRRPGTSSDDNPGTPVTLLAYSALNLQQRLLSLDAGTWTHAVNSNANIVPTVANGKVYVASNAQLRIFGLRGQRPVHETLKPPAPSVPARIECPPNIDPLEAVEGIPAARHEFHGTVCEVDGTRLRIALRTGRSVVVDMRGALALQPVLLTPGRTVRVQAIISESGVAHALRISRSRVISRLTPPDR